MATNEKNKKNKKKKDLLDPNFTEVYETLIENLNDASQTALESGGSEGPSDLAKIGSIASSTASGALSGAMIGGPAAPIGAAIGGAVGLLSGIFGVGIAGNEAAAKIEARRRAEAEQRRLLEERQDEAAHQTIAAIRTTVTRLRANTSKFEGAFSSGAFSSQGAKLLHDIGAMYGYQSKQSEGISSDLQKEMANSYRIRSEAILEGASAALNQKLDALSVVSSRLNAITSDVWESRRSGGINPSRLQSLEELLSA